MDTNSLDLFLQKEIDHKKSPSIQYFFFDQSRILYNFQNGLAKVVEKLPVNPTTTFHAFSVTKTFTAIAIIQMAEKGLIDIEKPVSNYLNSFNYGNEITIRNLLNHTAGIPNPIPLSWIHLISEHETFDRNTYFQPVFEKNNKVKFSPNEKFSYSNLGFILLGQLIEKVSGISYEKYITENIISRIGLTSRELGFLIPDFSNHATGYHKNVSFSNLILGLFIDKKKFMGKPEGAWKPFNTYYLNGAPYGGLIGTPTAFVKYISELLKPESTIITNHFKQMMLSENFTNNGRATGMSLGWYTGKLNGKKYFTHAGGGGGYYCEIRIYPETGFGSVVMFNRTGMTDERFLSGPDAIAFKMFS